MNEIPTVANDAATTHAAVPTRGPWHSEHYRSGFTYIVGSNGDLICRMEELREEANIALIAAAPDLLSALISLQQAYVNKHSPQHRAACLAEAAGAIRKATVA